MSTALETEVLDQAALAGELRDLDGWQLEQSAISKTYTFGSFLEAIAFVNRVAVVAENLDHHPDFIINYRKVTLRCWTHKNNAITRADVALAREIEKIA